MVVKSAAKMKMGQAATAQALLAAVNEVMGKGTITTASDPYFNVTYLKTGVAPIDDLLQGGIPFGRFVEIFGDYSTLKSYVALCAIRECQKMGKLAALIDTEHAFDPKWAKEIGVNLEDLIIKQPKNGEQAIDIAEVLIRGGVDLICFDSVAAALPKSEEETQLSGDKNIQPARLAQLMSLAMRKLTAANSKTAVLWINQTRVNVGVMFGSNESVPGGKALPYYASYRISFRKAAKVFEDTEVTVMDDGRPVKKKFKLTVAQQIRATVEKSKLNAPHRDVYFHFDFRMGQVDEWWYLATKCLDTGVLTYERKAWWVTGQTKKFHGRAEAEIGLPVESLKVLLAGGDLHAKSKAGSVNGNSSNGVARKSIRIQGRAGSKKTVRIRKQSTKSRMR